MFDSEFSRSMAHLACRFCRNETAVHVVDPLLDLRYRFGNLEALECMLRARLATHVVYLIGASQLCEPLVFIE